MAGGRPGRSLTILENGLLGLIALEPRSGYDVKRVFEETPMGRFSSSPGAIYPALARLERFGLLAARLESPHAARPRRVYTLTRAGDEALRDWLREPPRIEEVREDVAIALLRFSLGELCWSRRETLDHLRDLRRVMEEHAAEIEEHLERLDFGPLVNPSLALEHGVRACRATIDWIDHAIARLRAARKPSPRRTARRRGARR